MRVRQLLGILLLLSLLLEFWLALGFIRCCNAVKRVSLMGIAL